jgi:ferredoxin
MSETAKRHPLNAPGKYYIDCDTCLDHELCAETAPNNIRMDRELWAVAYVFKQPANPEEEAQCRRALEECPVEAIRDDGEV